MNKFNLSIIIPTWNRKKKLIKLLKILIIKLKKTNINYEIQICDSYSIDGTQKVLEKLYKNNKRIILRNIRLNSIARKRNEGIKNAKFKNILFLDDDCVPMGNFFNILQKNLNTSKRYQIFCGQYFTQKKLIKNSNYYRFRDLKNLDDKNIGEIDFKNIITGCCFFRVFHNKKFYYFNKLIKGYGLEDVDWSFKLKKRNFKLFLTEAKVDHQETSQNIGAYILKWYALSKDAMPLILKYNKNQLKGNMFTFEKFFSNSLIKIIFKFLNFLIIIPISIILKFFLLYTDKNKLFFIKNLFHISLILYYFRGACDRQKKSFDTKWYNRGYK